MIYANKYWLESKLDYERLEGYIMYGLHNGQINDMVR